jgi:tetratricopeptide (TPR) repeat protein
LVPDGYTQSVTRPWFATLILFLLVRFGAAGQVQEPPEEDGNVERTKEYTFNPLQAEKEIKVGNYYFKKGSFKAALRRFEEALKWDPNSSEAYLRLGDTQTKLGNTEGARTAYSKYLELNPDSKEAATLRKKLGKSKS